MLPFKRAGAQHSLSPVGCLGGGAVIVQVYAPERFKRESIRRECQAEVQTFSAESAEPAAAEERTNVSPQISVRSRDHFCPRISEHVPETATKATEYKAKRGLFGLNRQSAAKAIANGIERAHSALMHNN
jgi:hypothetical protein